MREKPTRLQLQQAEAEVQHRRAQALHRRLAQQVVGHLGAGGGVGVGGEHGGGVVWWWGQSESQISTVERSASACFCKRGDRSRTGLHPTTCGCVGSAGADASRRLHTQRMQGTQTAVTRRVLSAAVL